MDQLDTATGLVFQLSGDREASPVLYLPGVHGDWTPQSTARGMLRDDYHFIKTAYPRIRTWSIDDFAFSLKRLLDDLGIESVLLVGESFGSLVTWRFGIANPLRVRSFTLMGGFSRPPRLGVAGVASKALKWIPTRVLESSIDLYVAWKSVGGQHRETLETGAYPATRTVQGRHAVANRMAIIQASNFTETLKEIGFPVRYIGGANDIVVPVRREIATLSAHLSSQCDFRSELLVGAPHAFIPSHPEVTVEHLSRWVWEIETGLSDSSRLRGVS